MERPILFSGPRVRAILAGTMTQTRRVVKPRDPSWTYSTIDDLCDGHHWLYEADEAGQWHRAACRYGGPGDRLWVRETWGWYGRDRGDGPEGGLQYRADLAHRVFTDLPDQEKRYGEFKAAYQCGRVNKWRPSIHMPRWASRITLEVTGVRVERVQEITDADARAEGCEPIYYGSAVSAVEPFAELWDSINGKTYPWSSNPWVWVVQFKRKES